MRENFTQGSVRGEPGDRLSYRVEVAPILQQIEVMEISEQEFEHYYHTVSDIELIRLFTDGELTDSAAAILKNEIAKRGLTDTEIDRIVQKDIPQIKNKPLVVQHITTFASKIMTFGKQYFNYRKSEIIVVIVCVVLGYLFAIPAYGLKSLILGPMIFDGPCSGVWGPIEFQCYIPDVIYAALSVWVPVGIFRKRASKIAMLSTLSFFALCITLGTLFGNPLNFFQKAYSRPSILGVWISLWSVLVSAVLVHILACCIKHATSYNDNTCLRSDKPSEGHL